MGLTLEGEPHAQTVAAMVYDGIVTLQQIMSVDASLLTPTLIDAMDRVVAIDDAIDVVYLEVTLALIAVVIKNNMNRTILFRGDAEAGDDRNQSYSHLPHHP